VTPRELRVRATECDRFAQRAPNPHVRASLEEIARILNNLARDAKVMQHDRNGNLQAGRMVPPAAIEMPARNTLIVGKLANPAVFGGALAAREKPADPSYEVFRWIPPLVNPIEWNAVVGELERLVGRMRAMPAS
jgi:hypothetical protein